jgi:uncharacterized protein (PEP-CTERM system associated)
LANPQRTGGGSATSSRLAGPALVAAFGSLLASPPGWAAKWDFVAGASLEETYTDNLTLAPRGFERSDWVTVITPRLTVHGLGERARIDLDYTPQFLYYARESHTRFLQLYNATGSAELLERTLYVDARSAETQQVASLLGPVPVDNNVNLTQNRTAVRTNVISPYLLHDFGPQVHTEARMTWSKVDTDDPATLSDSTSTNVDLLAGSGSGNRQQTWNVGYHRERIDYTDAGVHDVKFERLSGSIRRLVTAQVALTATLGYEDNDFLTFGPEPKGSYWNAGFDWSPLPRTRLVANAGHRFFGTTAFADFSHRTRLTVWNFRYTKDITTSRDEYLVPPTPDTAGYLDTLFTPAYPDPAARLAAVNAFMSRNVLGSTFDAPVNFASSTPFLLKRAQASAGIEGRRNTILLTLFREDREALGPDTAGGDFAVSGKTRQTGGSVSWTTTLSPYTSASLGLGLSRDEFPDGGSLDARRRYARASLSHQFTPRVSASLTARHQQSDSATPISDYRENSVTAIVTARF